MPLARGEQHGPACAMRLMVGVMRSVRPWREVDCGCDHARDVQAYGKLQDACGAVRFGSSGRCGHCMYVHQGPGFNLRASTCMELFGEGGTPH
jgi:hypothetical protein